MNRIVPALIAWTARVVGWAGLLGLGAYLICNFQGITVRGQIARTWLRFEGHDAMHRLLEHAGLEHLHDMFGSVEARGMRYYDPLLILARDPAVLVVYGKSANSQRQEVEIYIVFDRDGVLVGTPIIVRRDAASRRFGGPTQIIEADSAHWLVCYEYTAAATTQPTSAPTTREFISHVYRLVDGESVEVFAIAYDCPRSQWPRFHARRHRDRTVALDLQVIPAGGPWNPAAVATFVWDETLGRFVGPQHDPQGRWEVLVPQPDPQSDATQ